MARTYVEVLIKGEHDLIKGFVMGFLEGQGHGATSAPERECILCEDYPLALLKHFLSGHPHMVRVLIDSELAGGVIHALNRHRKDIPSEIKSFREIVSVFFDLRIRTFSREVGRSLVEMLTVLPAGAALKDGYELQEKIDPEGKGLELFAPLHDYEMTFFGTVQGEVDGVYALYRAISRFEVAEAGELKLEYGKALAR